MHSNKLSILLFAYHFSILSWTCVESVGVFAAECNFEFCYDTHNSTCGQPNWPGRCKSGTRQSPINLPSNKKLQRSKSIQLNLKKYQADSFSFTNNGHTAVIRLAHNGNDNSPALRVTSSSFMSTPVSYHLDSAHFHWGTRDNQGSEHCFDGKCLAAELHLVHYQTKFANTANALASGEPNALAVLGILLDSSGKGKPIDDRDSFKTIFDHLSDIENDNDSEPISSQISFATVLKEFSDQKKRAFTYDGSLTTPCCSEVVNWFVFDTPVKVSRENVDKFHQLKDSHGQNLTVNYRELQATGNRVVSEASVSTT